MLAGIPIPFLVAASLSTEPAPSSDPKHGLLLTLGRDQAQEDHRRSSLLALSVEPDEAPSPFLDPGPLLATFTGSLIIGSRDRFTFAFEGVGRLKLELGGKIVLEADHKEFSRTVGQAIRLSAGSMPLTAHYESLGARSLLRVLWSTASFRFEPLPTSALRLPERSHGTLAGAEQLRAGRRLFAQLQCAACHAVDGTARMAEMAERAPDLVHAGDRLEPAFVAQWLIDPGAHRPGARMPRVLHGPSAAAQAADIAAYLGSLRDPEAAKATPQPTVIAGDDIRIGGELFASLGCIACHSLDEAAADLERIPLHQTASKFRPGALARFLQDPDRHHPSTRMPDFALDPVQAGQIAAFLTSRLVHASAQPVATAGDPVRGEQLFRSTACIQCHGPAHGEAPASFAAPSAKSLALRPTAGCLSPAPAIGKAPVYRWTAQTREALSAFVSTLDGSGHASLLRNDVAEATERQMQDLQCTACHAMDHVQGRWSMLADQTRTFAPDLQAPEVPSLTFAGQKLRPDYLLALLQGDPRTRARPWITAKMPAFASRAPSLARGLAALHGLSTEPLTPSVPVHPDPERVKIGAKLVGSDGGFACNLCHGVGNQPPLAVFESQGVNLALSPLRLRTEFYERWMWSPHRIDPASRMPRYADDRGKTAFVEVLDGDAAAQFDAIWSYLRTTRP